MYIKKFSTVITILVKLHFVLLFFAEIEIFAQDIHFSQFQSTPIYNNAANTGASDADFRLSNDYRSQWNKIDYPFNTLMLAGDARIRFLGRQAGIGAMLVHDQSMGNNLIADKFFLSFSHSFFYKNHKLIAGLQPGLVAKKIDKESLTFGNQFDPDNNIFNPALPGGEGLLNENLRYFDLNLGLLWQARFKTLVPSFGIAINHINRPVESFYSNKEEVLPLKYTFHGNIVVPLTEKFTLLPQVLYSYASGGKEFNGGSLLYFYPGKPDMNLHSVYALGSMRINPVRNFDALILGIGAQVAGFDVCFSYDINVSSLREVTRFQGAYELSLVFTAKHKKPISKNEPCYML